MDAELERAKRKVQRLEALADDDGAFEAHLDAARQRLQYLYDARRATKEGWSQAAEARRKILRKKEQLEHLGEKRSAFLRDLADVQASLAACDADEEGARRELETLERHFAEGQQAAAKQLGTAAADTPMAKAEALLASLGRSHQPDAAKTLLDFLGHAAVFPMAIDGVGQCPQAAAGGPATYSQPAAGPGPKQAAGAAGATVGPLQHTGQPGPGGPTPQGPHAVPPAASPIVGAAGPALGAPLRRGRSPAVDGASQHGFAPLVRPVWRRGRTGPYPSDDEQSFSAGKRGRTVLSASDSSGSAERRAEAQRDLARAARSPGQRRLALDPARRLVVVSGPGLPRCVGAPAARAAAGPA